MANYFRYKTAADVTADAARLGHELTMSDDLAPLFQPLEIGGRPVGNRLLLLPMEGCDGTLDGKPDELTHRRYLRFGRGGAKIIWGEAAAISLDVRMNPRQLCLREESLSDFEKMFGQCREAHRAEFGHDDDLLIGVQLTHSGRYSHVRPFPVMHDPLLDPRTIDRSTGRALDESYPLLSDDDLKRIEDQFVAAAGLAVKIGLDFVDIKQCHRYLLSELLAARSRTGPYGGSLENRTRLVRNIVGRIRAEYPGLIVATRLNCYDGIPFRKDESTGRGVPAEVSVPVDSAFGVNRFDPSREDLTEPIGVAWLLRDAGVAMINVTAGNPYVAPHLLRPAEKAPIDGYDAPEHPLLGVIRHFRLSRSIQQAVPDVPVAGSGYSWLQDFFPQAGAANIASGDVKLVGVGRGALSHPDFARVLQETGQLDRRQVCRTFSYCTNLMRNKNHPLGQYPTGCPPFDKEVYGPIWQEACSTSKPVP